MGSGAMRVCAGVGGVGARGALKIGSASAVRQAAARREGRRPGGRCPRGLGRCGRGRLQAASPRGTQQRSTRNPCMQFGRGFHSNSWHQPSPAALGRTACPPGSWRCTTAVQMLCRPAPTGRAGRHRARPQPPPPRPPPPPSGGKRSAADSWHAQVGGLRGTHPSGSWWYSTTL